MYLTLDNLFKFYSYIRSDEVLDTVHNPAFRQPTVNVNGSGRALLKNKQECGLLPLCKTKQTNNETGRIFHQSYR